LRLSAAASTFALVAADTGPAPLKASDAVDGETPASAATAARLGLPPAPLA
jgi:hypothetical protein